MGLVKNLGRREFTSASYVSKKIFQIWRYFSNFNLPVKARKNVEKSTKIKLKRKLLGD